MGLDSIELIIEIEKAFDISIPDEEAEKLTTVGKLHDAVWQHLEKRHSNRCNSQILFYRLRQYFLDKYGISKQSFLPTASINDLFPQDNRRKEYANFSTAISLELPRLVLPKALNSFLAIFGLVTIAGTLLYALFMAELFHHTRGLYLLPVTGIILTLVLSTLLNPWRVIIQPSSTRDFTEKILALNYALLTKEHGTNRKEVEMVIDQIIVDKIGVDPEEVQPDKSFTDDLGVD